jgi:hypothetical protein
MSFNVESMKQMIKMLEHDLNETRKWAIAAENELSECKAALEAEKKASAEILKRFAEATTQLKAAEQLCNNLLGES